MRPFVLALFFQRQPRVFQPLRAGQLALLATLLLSAWHLPAQAQDAPTANRFIEFEFRPTARAQVALWVETAGGEFVDTVRLTQAVSLRGIGNRPGAMLMNSGFRWPYGRREGVLPHWAHRRASAPDAELFPRVIFQNRRSEGFASRTSNDASADNYYCLSFDVSTTGRDALDAVTCASVFMSDKGRYATENDVTGGYAEPFEEIPAQGSTGSMRPLSLKSFYPPRRDATACAGGACADHPDLAKFNADARNVMPNIDAVTMATPPADSLTQVTFDVPAAWPDGEYVAFIEVNVEGDYNDAFNDATHPTPTTPEPQWDFWAKSYGYPYRGQPSVVYRLPFELGSTGTFRAQAPEGYTDIHGDDGALRSMGDDRIVDDPTGSPGSGADRLRSLPDGSRFVVRARASNVCSAPNPPPECGKGCSSDADCGAGFVCANSSCIGECDLPTEVNAPDQVLVNVHPDEKNSHQWGVLSFSMPQASRSIREFEVRVGTEPIVDEESFIRAAPAVTASIDTEALVIPTEASTGETVEASFGGLQPQTRYHVGIRARDLCNSRSSIQSVELETTEINFSTVTPCYVATAAYGTPYAKDIDALRAFRDQYLMTHAPGRLMVRAYYAVGPYAAAVIRKSEWLRWGARGSLAPAVAISRWLVGEE